VDHHRRPLLRGHDPQHVGGGPTDEQQVRRLGEVERRGLGEDVGGRDRERRAVAAGDAEGEDLVADLPATGGDLRVGPDRGQHTRDLEADGQRQGVGIGAAGTAEEYVGATTARAIVIGQT
jgi:hypothetical protein